MQDASKIAVRSALENRLNRMTILVGMVGSDGIILAADQCRHADPQSENEIYDRMGSPKITHLPKHSVAYAVAGDDLTDRLGMELSAVLDSKGLDDPSSIESLLCSLQAAADAKLQAEFPGRSWPDCRRSLLILFYGTPEPQLWSLKLNMGFPSAKRVSGMAIGGATANSARFFECYFQANKPIKKLLPLASHIVLTAGRLDPLTIDGLDVALLNDGVYRLLNESEKDRLRERSRRLDLLIRQQLFEGDL